ncbi:hypothetical protein [Microlunatus sp. Gsoil 973]|uniref:hypothetical protein n=1 Tax=Microlunatus sp. Gsoil 973 TaxID=2672569 RepID=UPI0012B45E5C|nr:hypothetical protein [Microlunatus sp. Gsoil 973]QGN33736.1 hypothetical protein GJV80_13975 [Microlunatus sp. Gsoil 973]
MVTIERYRVPGPHGSTRTIRSNDREVTLPATIASKVLAVTGLDNVQPQTFHSRTPRANIK